MQVCLRVYRTRILSCFQANEMPNLPGFNLAVPVSTRLSLTDEIEFGNDGEPQGKYTTSK